MLAAFGAVSVASGSDQRTLLYPIPDSASGKQVDWVSEIELRVPRLTRSLDGAWPLLLWRIIPPDQISTEVAAMLLERGLVAALPLDRSSIDAARILKSVGAPVVLTAGSGVGSSWPYNLESDESLWTYRFDDSQRGQPKIPIPTRFTGWSIAASQIKSVLRTFKEAGVTVDAAWLDHEGLPFQSRYSDAINSLNGRDYLPVESIRTPRAYYRYTRQLWVSLLSTYVAAPSREIFPNISVTNWLAVLSLPKFPVPSWFGNALPMVGPTMFTATNPVAYGIDTAFNARSTPNALWTQMDVDRSYTEILLRQVSADSYARSRIAPYLDSVVWIARWVRDDHRKLTPMMSRHAYREALRHVWLRGVDAMEIFSPVRGGFEDLAVQEIEDAAHVLDEMLEFREFLASGMVLNYDYGSIDQEQTIWSGLKKGDQAIIRTTSFSGQTVFMDISQWPDHAVRLAAPVGGATFLLKLNREIGSVEVQRFP